MQEIKYSFHLYYNQVKSIKDVHVKYRKEKGDL